MCVLSGTGAVLKAVTLTLLLYCLLPAGIFQAMWRKSGGGSKHCPSDFELSLCKTAEKELPESHTSLGTAGGTALGLSGVISGAWGTSPGSSTAPSGAARGDC